MRSATKRKLGKDAARLEWTANQPCWITGKRPATVHHVRFCGSRRDDNITLPLIPELHMRTHEKPGVPCIERGKKIFEQFHGVSIDAGVLKYQELWEKEKTR
jgi:hypothetical protein